MNPMSMLPLIVGIATFVLGAAIGMQSAGAAEAQAPEVAESACSVTDEQIVAATARQPVTLDTPGCTAGLEHMVESTFAQVQKSYAAFHRQTHLNPTAVADVSLLLVRRQLLSADWSAGLAEHYSPSKDPGRLADIEAQLHEYLTPQQIASLDAYEKTIPARAFAEPVVSRLEKHGRPVSEAQYEEALQELQQFLADWLKIVPEAKSADPLQACRDTNARAIARDERIKAILARSLDERQRQIEEGYYRDLFERRARMLQIYESKLAREGHAICAYPAS